MAHDVFVSYSHKDKAVADAIVAQLESNGSRCWYAPRDITPGADWAASIVEAIGSSRVMVLVFTDFANSSQQVMREVNSAVSAGVTIIPFRLTKNEPTGSMQYYLATVHWLDALSLPLEASVRQLEAQVRANLTGMPAPQPAVSQGAAPAKRALPGWAFPAIGVAAAIVLAVALALPRLVGGGATGGGQAAGADTPALEQEAAGDEEEAADEPVSLEAIAVPTNGSAQIQDPANSGSQGNLQGNYQNEAYAASDGEWFYYRGSDGHLYKMLLDGSEKTELSSETCASIGVLDGYVYYATTGSSGFLENICRMTVEGTQRITLYTGMFEDMVIVDGRIYFKNSLDGLKLYSIALDGTDARCEGETSGLYYLTFWNGLMYWANDDDGRCLYRANYDGSNPEKLTDTAVDCITVSDGWIMYNDLGDYHLHMLNAETLEDHQLSLSGVYDPVISPYGILGQNPAESLHLFRVDLGTNGANTLTSYRVDHNSVCEGYVFFVNDDDGMVYMMDVYGDSIVQL